MDNTNGGATTLSNGNGGVLALTDRNGIIFVTGTSSFDFYQIRLGLRCQQVGTFTFRIELYNADTVNNLPVGAALSTNTVSRALTTTATYYTFPITGMRVVPNTAYMIVVYPTVLGGTSFNWADLLSPTSPTTRGGIRFRTYMRSANSGTSWSTTTARNSITVFGFDQNSDVTRSASFTEPVNIAYNNFQEAANLTTANSIEVGRFTLRDGAGTIDNDTATTTISNLTLNVTNFSQIRRLALYDGTTELAEAAVTAGTVSFTGLNIAAADNANKDFSVRVSFQSAVTDNTQFQISVSSATSAATGSGLQTIATASALTSITGDANRIEVTATALSFQTQPTNTMQNSVMSPSPVVRALDGLGSLDLDFTSAISLTTTAAFAGGSTTSVNATSGVSTFSNLSFTTPALARTLTANATGLTAATSSNFAVASLLQEGDIAVISYFTENPHRVAIVTLADIYPGSVFYITNNVYNGSSLITSKKTITWSADPTNLIPRGTVVTFTHNGLSGASSATIIPSGLGSVTGSIDNFSPSGDVVFVYRLDGATPVFLSGFTFTSHNGGAWRTSGAVTNNDSYLPPGLTDKRSAGAFSSVGNGSFNRSTRGNTADLRNLIYGSSNNWTRSSLGTSVTYPTGGTTWTLQDTTVLDSDAAIQNIEHGVGQALKTNGKNLTILGSFGANATISSDSLSSITISGSGSFGSLRMDANNGKSNNAVKDLIVNRSGQAIGLANRLNLHGKLRLEAGTMNVGGNLCMRSTANTQGVYDYTSTGTISGNLIAERFVEGVNNRWRGFSAPVGGNYGDISDSVFLGVKGIDGSNLSTTREMFRWNGARFFRVTNWRIAADTNIDATLNGVITPGRGFIMYMGNSGVANLVNGASTLDLTGNLNLNPVSAPGMVTSTAPYNGWILVGNPYLATLDWQALHGTADCQNLASTIYLFNPSTNNFDAYNAATQTGTGVGSRYIAPFQAVLVKASSATLTPSLTFRASHTVANTSNYNFRTSSLFPMVRMNMMRNGVKKAEAMTLIAAQATDTLDADFDSPYPGNFHGLRFYSEAPGQYPLLQNSRPMPAAGLTEVYFFEADTTGAYSMSPNLEQIPANWNVYLHDRITNVYHNLRNGAYTFQHQLTNRKDRFELMLNTLQTSTVNADAETIRVRQEGDFLLLELMKGNDSNQTLNLVDLQGRQVATWSLETNTGIQRLPLPSVARGIYWLQLNGTAVGQKIAIH